MTNDVEHLYMCLFAIYVSYVVKYLLKLFSHFKSWVIFLLLSFEKAVII